MVFWTKDVEEKILKREDSTKMEDLIFLRNQQTERQFSVGGLDKKLAKTVEKVVKRKASELKQKQSEEDRKAAETESRT